MSRKIEWIYRDPIDVIWSETAQRCGMEVVRDPDVFASWDGQRILRIGDPESLDPDDSLAQMILHELCHAFVEGPAGQRLPDWGLDFENPNDQRHEFACLRLQARLADTVGLRQFFASTTDFREYYDQLPAELAETSEASPADEITKLAIAGWNRFLGSDWEAPIRNALLVTRKIADALQPFAGPNDLWHQRPAPVTTPSPNFDRQVTTDK